MCNVKALVGAALGLFAAAGLLHALRNRRNSGRRLKATSKAAPTSGYPDKGGIPSGGVEVLRWISKRLDAAATAEEFILPKDAVVAAHQDKLAAVGPVQLAVLLSHDKGRYVVVVMVGRRSAEPVVRIHSSCLYGDALGSLGCDCGDQLRASLARMRAAGSGILIYLDQEGRGAGLNIKAVAIELAERLGLRRTAAFAELGFASDLRTYDDAVRILKLLDVSRCLLLTNNQAKVRALEQAGITVRREARWMQKARTGRCVAPRGRRTTCATRRGFPNLRRRESRP